MILFTHGGHCEWTEKWAYRDRNNGYAEKQPNYDQVKSIFQTRPFDNGGFEEANDPITEWVPIIPFDQAVPPNDTAFIRNDPDGARTGNGYLKFTMDGRLKRTVRRIITGLEPGATYEVGVYCAVRGGGVAQLDVRGFDPLDGDASVLHKIDNRFDGEWEPLKVRFVAGNSWAVLSLLADYPNEVRFDDVTVTLVDPGIPDEAGVEK